MGANAALVLELLIAAVQHASELSTLLRTAQAQGRDITVEELAALFTAANASVDRLQSVIAAKSGVQGAQQVGAGAMPTLPTIPA